MPLAHGLGRRRGREPRVRRPPPPGEAEPLAEGGFVFHRRTLVVFSGNPNDVVSGLRKLGIRVLLQPAARNLSESYAEISRLGVVTGHTKSANALVRRMKTAIAKSLKSVPKLRLSVYHELDPTYYSATSQTFIGRIYKLFGLRNIADAADSTASGYPQLSGEYILSQNPGLIVLADTRCCGQSAATVANRPGWGGIAAVRNHRVVGIDDSVASRWGPRVVNLVQALAKALKRRG